MRSNDSPSATAGKALPWILLLLVVGFVAAAVFLRGESGPAEDDSPAVLARERAAAYFDEDLFAAARDALAPLVEGPEVEAADLLRAVNVELAGQDFERAGALLDRAERVSPHEPAVHWSRYRIARDEGRLEDSLTHVRRAVELAPDDYPTKLALANTLNELSFDRPELFTEAEALYRELLARGKDYSGSWYLTTLYRYSNLLRFAEGRSADADRYLGEYQQLALTLTVPSHSDLDRGTFGSLAAPPKGALAAGPTAEASPVATELGGPVAPRLPLAGIVGMRDFQLRDDAPSEDTDSLVQRIASAPEALLTFGRAGIHLVRLQDGALVAETVSERASTLAHSIDLDAEERAFGQPVGPAEILSTDGPRLVQFVFADGVWTEQELWTAPATIHAVVPVDFDHEGDLDLLVVGEFGARLLRNDGAGSSQGGFVDASGPAKLPASGNFTWAAIEDFDSDQDVDLFFGGPDGLFWFDNERGGNFVDRTADLPVDLKRSSPLWLDDFDGDGLVDVASTGRGEVWFADGLGGFLDSARPISMLEGSEGFEPTPLGETRRYLTISPAIGWSSARVQGREREFAMSAAGLPSLEGSRAAFADLDGDRRAELFVANTSELHGIERQLTGNTLRLWLAGEKDNRRGVGAIVEVRSGAAYRRFFWDGRPQVLNVGERPNVDVLRITWPNGVVQTLVDLATGTDLRVRQKEGLVGSCPFLYTWNGSTFEFISDVLGITPLGLPMAPGMLVPPDHDEYVLIRGDQLVPKDGAYVLQFTEELREVTYLDRARLDIVDHPADVEIYPNERFTFPPFPEPHTHTIDGALSATRVVGSDGADWTAQLARLDESFAQPFESLSGAFLGLATPHFLEFAFDPQATREATQLRLVMTGWFYWTDASVNMASAGHPNAAFIPPLLQVPDAGAEGGWRTIEPPLGFPAGKLKTMVVDVSERLDPADPRFRIFSSLRIYWDAIRLAVDEDDAATRVTALEPTGAELWSRGFSAPSDDYSELGLEWFEWERLEDEPRWNQHPGLYTRFGDCLPLLGTVDDRYVIMGAGDALTLRFDARRAPPLPDGWTRDFLLYLDGWAKDRDPNSHEALFVEPLPFHGMSGYPYGAGESFPDSLEHRTWRARWNTRPAQRWIAPLAPTVSKP